MILHQTVIFFVTKTFILNPALGAAVETVFQFERLGFFVVDPDTSDIKVCVCLQPKCGFYLQLHESRICFRSLEIVVALPRYQLSFCGSSSVPRT